MKITSSYQKKLNIQLGEKSLGIEPNQVVTVDDEIGKELIKSPWIIEIKDSKIPPTFGCCGRQFGQKKPIKKKVEEPVVEVHVPIKKEEIKNIEIKKEEKILKKDLIKQEERSNKNKTIKD